MIKKVVKDNSKSTVEVKETREGKIYAYKAKTSKDIFKLHCINISERKWAFILLNDSVCWADGSHKSMQDAIRANMNMDYDIYEFDNVREFIDWLYNNT